MYDLQKEWGQVPLQHKTKPGPKSRKREIEDVGQNAAEPARHISSATGLATVGVGGNGMGGNGVGGDGGSEGGGLPRATSPSSKHLSTPSKRVKRIHGQDSRVVAQPKHQNMPPPVQEQQVYH